MRLVDVRSLKGHRDFRLFFGGQFVSLIGSWMQSVAQGWLVYRLTGSALTLGAVSFASNIPVLLLGPAAGWVADRYPRRKTVIVTHLLSMAQASTLAFLALTDRVTVTHVFVLAVVFGISNAFEMPSRQSLVGDLVGREDLPNAIALNSSMITLTRIIGPAIAGVVVATLGEGLCFSINAVSFLAALASLIAIRVPARPRPLTARNPFRQMADGLAYVRGRRPIAALLGLLALCSLMSMPQFVLLPVFAKELGSQATFGLPAPGGPAALGILHASAGLGALIGALSLASKRGMHGFGGIVVRSIGISGLALIALSASPWLLLSAALLVPVGFGLMRQLAATNTLLQSMAADDMRGRVMSFYSIMLVGLAPFGALIAGASADGVGAHWTTAAIGGVALVIAAGAMRVLPGYRVEARELLRATGAMPGDPTAAKTADVAAPAMGTPAGARSDLHEP